MPSSNVLSYFRANHKRNSSDPTSLSPVRSQERFPLQSVDSAQGLRPQEDVDSPTYLSIPRAPPRHDEAKGRADASRNAQTAGLPGNKDSQSSISVYGPIAVNRQDDVHGPPTLKVPEDQISSSTSPSPSPLVLSSSSDGRFSPSPRAQVPSKPPVSNPQRSSKTRLNLLNPMALLMKRRSPQALEHLADPGGNRNLTVPAMPDDFDPRIRGTGVHDFNAPRPIRNRSHNDLAHLASPAWKAGDDRSPHPDNTSEDDKKQPDKEHTPVFKEHFDDEDWSKTDDLEEEDAANVPNSRSIPAFARRLPPTVSEAMRRSFVEDKSHEGDSTTAPVNQEDEASTQSLDTSRTLDLDDDVDDKELSEEASRVPQREKSRSSTYRSGLPRHMTSNASRFSFDLSGVGSSAQEKLLEEKHRQKAQARKSAQSMDNESVVDDEGMYDMDDFDDDGGFEERIPGVNADADDEDEDPFGYDNMDFEEAIPGVNADPEEDGDDFGDDNEYDEASNGRVKDIEDDDPTLKPAIGGFDFQLQQNAVGSPTKVSSPIYETVTTPRDADGRPIGFAETKETPENHHNKEPVIIQTPLTPDSMSPESQRVSGLGLVGFSEDFNGLYGQATISPPASHRGMEGAPQMSPQSELDEDDLYFDDGMIEQPPLNAEGSFDESWFDNEADELEANPARMAPVSYSQNKAAASSGIARPISMNSVLHGSQSLTVNTDTTRLSDYHDALVAATMAAEANGAFDRNQQNPTEGKLDVSTDNLQPLTPPAFVPVEDSLYDISDDLDDDAIVTAANAEALANDDDGFYGQEFNFYSSSAEGSPYINGGYFGDPSGLNRQGSNRLACREPNLTPITERSEASNRNSMSSSFHMSGSAINHAGSSPITNLAQLQTMLASPSVTDDEDMSYSALMRLRRGAFGGSSSSLPLSVTGQSPISGSPLTHIAPVSALSSIPALSDPLAAHSSSNGSSGAGANDSTGSVVASDSEQSPASPSPATSNAAATLAPQIKPNTAASHAAAIPSITPLPPPVPHGRAVSDSPDSSPIRRSSVTPWKKGHRRDGSGEKESVSYRRVEEGEGWVLEKRRMSATGEMQVVERERVDGARI